MFLSARFESYTGNVGPLPIGTPCTPSLLSLKLGRPFDPSVGLSSTECRMFC